jgi:hypothetical protein
MKPKVPERKSDRREEERPRREGDLKHILDTGLPPGVEIEDAKDPGRSTGGGPADDRS